MDHGEVSIVGVKRDSKNVGKTALLEKDIVGSGKRIEQEENESGNMFWPSGEENDARLFEESDGECAAENFAHDRSSTTSALEEVARSQENAIKIPGRRRLCKVKRDSPLPMASELAAAKLVDPPSDSESSHISIDTRNNADDLLCNKLGSLSLTRKEQGKGYSANSAGYKSATSSLESRSVSDDNADIFEVSYNYSKASKQKETPAEGLVLGEGKLKFVLPGKISTILSEHQHTGIRWLWKLHIQRRGGILGDDMGLGKTMQIAAFLRGLFHSRLIKRAVIVAPKPLEQ